MGIIRRPTILLTCVLAIGLPTAGPAEPLQHELLVFTSAEGAGTYDNSAGPTAVRDETLEADVLFSLQHGPFRLFGEYLASDHEADLERFQLGWQVSDDTILWAGRYHQPGSLWNHEYHRGQYLQTSISRPQIDEWEDLGGVIPQHFTGVLAESSRTLKGSWRLQTDIGGGLAPVLTPRGLKAYDLIDPGSARRQIGIQASAAIYTSEFSDTGAGVLASHDELSAVGWQASSGFDHVDLASVGLFGIYTTPVWKLTATASHVFARLNSLPGSAMSQGADHGFIVGYMQVERRLPHQMTAYVRWEESSGANSSRYLKLFQQFARAREIAGLRWDVTRQQAVTLQLSSTQALRGGFRDIRFQWSAAFF